MTLSDLAELARAYGQPSYRAEQMARWLYKTKVTSFEEMRNVGQSLRASLSTNFEVGRLPPESVAVSKDGTKKYLYRAADWPKRYVESAYIPDANRATLCLSTQVGCRRGCLFCMTGKQGFQGNLSGGAIANQYLSLPEREAVTNVVYMGMGEPMDNVDAVLRSLRILTADWGCGISQKRITVSTIGVIPGLKRFIAESRCHLAVSLHSPFDDERRELMPADRLYPVQEVLDVVRSGGFDKQRRVSFEYIVFGGLNHSRRHAKELARLLGGIPCRINLIQFHTIPGTTLKPASRTDVEEFQSELKKKGFRVTIRKSRGQDVQAACGLLSTKRSAQGDTRSA